MGQRQKESGLRSNQGQDIIVSSTGTSSVLEATQPHIR
jgi:hypothetical protein